MKIAVKGTKSQRVIADIKDAIKFYARILMKKRVRDKIKIYVDVDTKKKRDRDDCFGMCEVLGTNENTGLKEYRLYCVHQPRRFSKDKNNVFKTIAHEMVHIKQYATNELGVYLVATRSPSGRSLIRSKWKGKLYKTTEDDSNDNHYYEAPWEIEAYGREIGLYRRWRKSRGEMED